MKIHILGHCYEPGKHDKIWGVVSISSDIDRPVLVFWGRRQGSLSFKWHNQYLDAVHFWYQKHKKGYESVDPESPMAQNLLPADFQGQVMLAQLGQTKYDLPENA